MINPADVREIRFITRTDGNAYLQFVHADGRESRLVHVDSRFNRGDSLYFRWGEKEKGDFSISGTFES